MALAIVASVSLLGPSILSMRVFHGTDILQRHAPWLESPPDGVEVTNPLIGDTVDAFMPGIAELRTRMQVGDLPMWSGYSHGGVPFAPMPHSGLFSPFNLPYWILPLDYAPVVVKLLELTAAIGFTFLFLRRQGLGRHAAALGGLIFAFSGFQVAWTNWSHPHVAALIPALLWAIDRAIAGRTVDSALPLAGILAAMWAIGFPSVTGYALVFGALFAMAKLVWVGGRDRIVAAARPLLGVVLGTGLAAFLLLPFTHWLATVNLAARAQHPGATLARRTLATLAVPNSFGSPVTRNYYGPADYFIYGPVNWVENQVFIGIMALCLIAAAAVYGSQIVDKATRVFLWASVALCLALIYTGGPLLSVAQSIPLFGSSHVGRLRSVLLFLLAALAAVGFEALRRHQETGAHRRPAWVLAPLLVIGWVVVAGLVKAHEMAFEAGHQEFFWSQVWVATAVTVMAVSLLVASRIGRIHVLAMALIPLVIAFEAMTFAGPWWPQIEHEAFYPTTDAHVFLQEHLGDDRMVVTGMTMLPSSNSFYGIRSVTAHSFPTQPWADLLRAADPDAFRLSPTFSSIDHDAVLLGSPVLDRLAARYSVTDPRQRVFGERRRIGPSTSEITVEAGWHQEIDYQEDLQAIVIELPAGFTFTAAEGAAEFTVELVLETGEVVATSRRRLATSLNPGLREIAVVHPTGQAATVRVAYVSGPDLRLATRDDGSAIVALVLAGESTPRVAFAGGAVIYHRPEAMSRVRWASEHLVLEDPNRRVEALSSGLPESTVILSALPTGPGPGGDATVTVMEASGDRLVASVEATGWGHLVIMDALIGMWRATLDGVPVPLVEADHAGAAVLVPPGEHLLVLEPEIPGWGPGIVITGISALVVALLALSGRRTRRLEPGSPG